MGWKTKEEKMKKFTYSLTGVLLAGLLSACSSYRQVEKSDGTKKTTVTIAPGTTITVPNGACISSGAQVTCQPPAN
jgi:uncharacterized lipoprotein